MEACHQIERVSRLLAVDNIDPQGVSCTRRPEDLEKSPNLSRHRHSHAPSQRASLFHPSSRHIITHLVDSPKRQQIQLLDHVDEVMGGHLPISVVEERSDNFHEGGVST